MRAFRALASSSRLRVAIAGGVALSAYVAHQSHTIQAAETGGDHIFVINGCVRRRSPCGPKIERAPPSLPSRASHRRGCRAVRSFYMAMREKFTKPGSSIYFYLVEWEPSELSWEDFRGKVLGATDPSTAASGSLRREIFSQWKGLGLAAEPNVGDNGVHASASPFEALAERLNWMSATLEGDAFGKAMLASGIPKDTIMEWTKDPQVPFEGKKASLFDLLEDLNYDECLAKSQAIAGVSGKRPAGKMQAYVFIKPHAVTEPAKKLVASKFAEAGITVYKEGSLDASVIEKDKLIDNHYYAIANKASLSKPAELNPPASKQVSRHLPRASITLLLASLLAGAP